MKIHPSASVVEKFDTHLSVHTSHLWLSELDITEDEYHRLWKVLNESERARAQRYCFSEHRRRFVACRGQLKFLLAAYTAHSPESILLITGKHGKPRLEGHEPNQGLVFNVSYSSGRALLAVGYDSTLGVDLEFRRTLNNLDAMVNRCFSLTEKDYGLSLSVENREQLFFSYWTYKEAIMKAEGRGLSLGMNRCVVAPDSEPYFTSLPASCGDPNDWALYDVACGDQFNGALVVKDRKNRVVYRSLPRTALLDRHNISAIPGLEGHLNS